MRREMIYHMQNAWDFTVLRPDLPDLSSLSFPFSKSNVERQKAEQDKKRGKGGNAYNFLRYLESKTFFPSEKAPSSPNKETGRGGKGKLLNKYCSTLSTSRESILHILLLLPKASFPISISQTPPGRLPNKPYDSLICWPPIRNISHTGPWRTWPRSDSLPAVAERGHRP